MTEYHVGAGRFGIYAGVLDKNGEKWKDKNNVTDEAIEAVRDYMYDMANNDEVDSTGWQWTRTDGRNRDGESV